MVHTAPEIYMSNVISNSEDTVFKISLETENVYKRLLKYTCHMTYLIANSEDSVVKMSLETEAAPVIYMSNITS